MAKGKAVAVAGGALYLTLAAAAACPFPMREGELSLSAQVARHARPIAAFLLAMLLYATAGELCRLCPPCTSLLGQGRRDLPLGTTGHVSEAPPGASASSRNAERSSAIRSLSGKGQAAAAARVR
jgi:hypothetical protein